MKQLATFLFSFLLSINLLANTTVIQGDVVGFDGENVRIAYYDDYITFNKYYLGSVEIKDGKFRLEFELDQTRQLLIFIQNKQTSLFAEAGQVYNVSLSYNDLSNSARAFEKYLDLQFPFPKNDELNQRIKQFNKAYQKFFSDNYSKIVVREAEKEIEEFIKEQRGNEKYNGSNYLKNYVEYALANLQDIAGESDDKLYNSFLEDKPVLADHKEYMNFFVQFYAEDFEQVLLTKEGSEIMKAMMMKKDLNNSLKLIMKKKSFDNKSLAELYLVNGLFEVYHKKTIDQESNLILLAELTEKASEADIRITAQNVLKKLQQDRINSSAPAFSLENTSNEMINSDELKGKPVYLGFWANYSLTSLRELKLMEKLQEEFGDQIHFVSVNIDENKEIYKKVKEENSYEWTFLYAGDEYELRDEYQVKTAPVYFLIDEKGIMLKRYAAGPAQIRRELKALLAEGS